MGDRTMGEFWDRRAEEDAFYFVDNRLDYRDTDLETFWEGGRRDLDEVLGRLGVQIDPQDAVLEIGCGIGRITRVLAERANWVWAIDVSDRMLARARELNPDLANVRWIHGDGRSLEPLDSESADGCFSHVVFQHIPDPVITLDYVREMGRVLRPGGWSAFQVSNLPAIHQPRSLRERARDFPSRMLGKSPRGQAHEAWLGSAVELGALRLAAEAGGAYVERISGEGTQWCLVLLRKAAAQ